MATINLPAIAHMARGASRLAVEGSTLPRELHRTATYYLMHMALSLSLPAIAAVFGISKQAVSKAVLRIEDLRDRDGALDAELTRLEAALLGGDE